VFFVRKNEIRGPHVASHHILVNDLRKFGRVRSVGHQAIDGFEKGRWRGEKFDADQITIARLSRLEVPDPRVGDRGLAIEHQADRLDRLDRERLVGFDQRAVVCEVMHAHRIAGVEGSPERSEDFETHPGSSIAGGSHHR
jgi:hypothetical protein